MANTVRPYPIHAFPYLVAIMGRLHEIHCLLGPSPLLRLFSSAHTYAHHHGHEFLDFLSNLAIPQTGSEENLPFEQLKVQNLTRCEADLHILFSPNDVLSSRVPTDDLLQLYRCPSGGLLLWIWDAVYAVVYRVVEY